MRRVEPHALPGEGGGVAAGDWPDHCVRFRLPARAGLECLGQDFGVAGERRAPAGERGRVAVGESVDELGVRLEVIAILLDDATVRFDLALRGVRKAKWVAHRVGRPT